MRSGSSEAEKAQAETQRRQAVTQRLDAVTQAIDAGQYGQADLERDVQAGLFADAPEAAGTFTRAIAQRHDREEARQKDLQRVNDAQAGKAVLDPAKPEDVAAVEAWWKARQETDPKAALTSAVAIARRTQILPDAARQQILDGLAYGTPEKQAEAAKALDALNQDAPAVAEALPLAARTRADVIGRVLAQGRDAPAAAAIAEQLLGPAPETAKAARVAPMGRVMPVAYRPGGELPAAAEGASPAAENGGDRTAGEQVAMSRRPDLPIGDPGATDPAKRYDPTGGPIDLGAKRFLADFADADDTTFDDEARKHGFDPERMKLFRDIYLGRDSVENLRKRAEGLYGNYWAGQVFRAAEQAAQATDPAVRMTLVEQKLKIGRADRESQDKLDELVGGATKAVTGAMAAARIAKSLFPSAPREVVDAARAEGNKIREKVGLAARRLAEDATLLPLEPIAEMARRRFEEKRDGKEFKAEFEPKDFGKDISRDDAIHAFAEAELAGALRPSGQHVAQLNLGKVDPGFAERLKKDTDVDVFGMRHVIDTGQVKHAFERHGPGKETDQHQVPLTPEAMSAYVNAVENYDSVEGPRKVGRGATLSFRKRINGTLVVVEQQRSAKGEFAFYTMWIEKSGKP